MRVDAIPNNLGIRAGGEEANAVVCKITIHRFESGLALHKFNLECIIARVAE